MKLSVDVMQHGSGMYGIPITFNEDQVETLPWATRYMQCPKEDRDLCDRQENRFRTKCWVDRDDVTPPTKQREHSPSQVKWHPGFRVHQLKGRVMAVTILDALHDAIATWSDITIYGMISITMHFLSMLLVFNTHLFLNSRTSAPR